ncbi:ElyC/SanA/YdcF family protein [Gulosibacter faecalis]|uniref:ElyC/SanA/YdcF family protein n=1 Tax=Gulosibacter faecalis TaxID=272240 RepID=A0ABW5V0U6_9MICO|nr:ElyC/SanA/YdcF family protein [Gulosibacter faecalis]
MEAPALLALFFGALLLPVVLIPYVGWSNRRGVTGPGHALISAAGVVYFAALRVLTIFPPPDSDLLEHVAIGVAAFIPFGALVRYLFGARVVTTVAIGVAVSLAIETTQVTGVFGLNPSASGPFDVVDLLANTVGALIGCALAPLLARVPGQHRHDPHEPARVTAGRRLVAGAVDAVTVFGVGFGLPLSFDLALALAYPATFETMPLHAHIDWVYAGTVVVSATLAYFVVPAAIGATFGQRLAYLRVVQTDGASPGVARTLIRFIAGGGTYFVLIALSTLEVPVTAWLAHTWAVVAILAILIFSSRGVSGWAADLRLIDARDPDTARAAGARDGEPRRMSAAVLALGGIVYLGFALLLGLASLLPVAGLGLGLLGAIALLGATLWFAGYLLVAGMTTLRREGRTVSNLLGIAAVVGVIGVAAVFVVAVLLQVGWLIVVTVAALGLTAYLAFVFFAFLGYGQVFARLRPRAGFDAVVVLGSKVFGDRVPPLLAARIDRGLEAQRQELAEGRRPVLICSGGKGDDEQVAEGEAMARYAIEHGAERSLVRAEAASTNTDENLRFSLDLLRREGRGEQLLVATNDYHAFRAAMLSRRLRIDAQVVGAKTARDYFPSAVLREYIAVLVLEKWTHLVLGGVTALSALLAWMIVRF